MSLINKMNVGNTNYDIQDRLMPDAIGQAGQVLKVKDDGSGLEFSTIESGGGKLYRHNMYFYSSQSDGFKITVYTSDITNFTPETFFADSKNSGLYCSGIVLKDGKAYPISEILINSALKRVIYIKSDGGQTFINVDPTTLEGPDKVYEV